MGRLPRRFLSSWIKDVRRPRGRPFLSYGHDLARELRAVGFNLDRGAQAIGVSRDWVAVAQNRVAWRSLVAAGSCRSLDERQPEDDDSSSSSSEGSSSLMSSPAGLTAADANPSSSQGPLAGDLPSGSSSGNAAAVGLAGQQPPDATWAGRLRSRAGRRGNT